MMRFKEKHPKGADHFVHLPHYGICVRADGAVKTKNKGVNFGVSVNDGYQHVWTKLGYKGVHRLVLEAFCGHSDDQVNHKNGVRCDNRLANLEYCTAAYNIHDRVRRNGARGCYQRRNGSWQAQITHNWKKIAIGTYGTEEEAHEAYLKERDKLWGVS